MNRRVQINPCDYLFWGQHRIAARKGETGNIAFMFMDLEGYLDPQCQKDALAAAMRAHPVTRAGFSVTPPLGRPCWRLPRDHHAGLEDAVEKAYSFEDLRDNRDWKSALARRCRSGTWPGLDLRRGPLVRLEHFSLPEKRTRLCLRWPHMLMDAEGSQWFLQELGRGFDSEARTTEKHRSFDPRPPSMAVASTSLAAEHEVVDPLSECGFLSRWRLFLQGTTYQKAHNRYRIRTLPLDLAHKSYEHRVIHRNWTPEETRAMHSAAKRLSPAGPARYARHLAVSIVSAVHRLYIERCIDTEAYLITMPQRVGFPRLDGPSSARRPLHGNYLVSPMLCVSRRRADDRNAVGEDILAQLTDYHRQGCDLMQWSMMWAASLLHAWAYELIFLLPFGSGRFATGFSFYGEIDPPVRCIGGARVLNLWGGGPNTTPPGWNPVFSRFHDRLNFTLTYTWPAVSDELAERYVGLIEEQVFRED